MGNFSKEVLAKKPIPNDKLKIGKNFFIGQAAVDRVQELEGPLTLAQKRIIELEGFATVPYLVDDVWHIGVGQTEKFKNKTFKEAFLAQESRLVKKIPRLAGLPEPLQIELMQSAYRGGITGSPKTVDLINRGLLVEAAEEFLDNKEFQSEETSQGVKSRMESVSAALRTAGDIEGQLKEAVQIQPIEQNVAPAASKGPSRGLTEEEQAELEFLRNDLSLRAQAEEVIESVGLTAEEEAELEFLRNDLGVVSKGQAFEEPTIEKTEQDFIEEIF